METHKDDGTIFKVHKLHKIFDNGTHALKGVSFDVKKGEFLVVIGLSGSGKSTLLRCLNQLNTVTSGDIFFKDRPISHALSDREKRSLRTRVAMIFQQFNLIRRRNVLTNVMSGTLGSVSTLPSLFGIFSDEIKAKALKNLELVGIRQKAHVRADSLSGGQQQRVAIARALMQDPEVILADEPVASLDPSTAHTVMDYLEKINKEMGVTIICNLHFLSLVRRYAHRVIALKGGEVVFEGDPKEINDEWFKKIYGEDAREVHVT